MNGAARTATNDTDDSPNTTTIKLGELQRRLLDGPDRRTQYSDDNFLALLRESFGSIVAEHDTKLVSVDVFDTMLMREPT
ncbi:MAG: hypothetical protein IH940_07075, partial [Acidobacteria bacterium]|nr:hypothetical protein [Acidobacteriota bacterium]